MISIHTLLAESDIFDTSHISHQEDFNPHSPRREWPATTVILSCTVVFQSTLSSQRVTNPFFNPRSFWSNFNPHSPRREWPAVTFQGSKRDGISIHTLLAESDAAASVLPAVLLYFNPHSPRREWRNRSDYNIWLRLFQSTLSSQRVTPTQISPGPSFCNFNPHSPRREWLYFQ